jgi:hypothetical protein
LKSVIHFVIELDVKAFLIILFPHFLVEKDLLRLVYVIKLISMGGVDAGVIEMGKPGERYVDLLISCVPRYSQDVVVVFIRVYFRKLRVEQAIETTPTANGSRNDLS